MLNLPALRSNPFDTRPLGRGQMELMVGRDEIFEAIANNIRLASPRIIGVVGEKGSGRTSLVQSVAATADQIHTVFWPSKDHVTTILHQMYCDLMRDFETPPVHSVMIDRLEEELSGRTGLLPLIIFDHPLLPGPELAEVLTQLLPVLTKLRVLTIITLTPGQKSGFSEELLSEMDLTPALSPLDKGQIARLISKRVGKASRSAWTAPEALLVMAMEESGGHVGRAMKYLRDVVDQTRGMPLIDGRKLDLKIEISAKPPTAVEDSTFQRVAEAAPKAVEIATEVSESLQTEGELDENAEMTDSDNNSTESVLDDRKDTPSTTIPEPLPMPKEESNHSLFPSLSDSAGEWENFHDEDDGGSPQLDSEPEYEEEEYQEPQSDANSIESQEKPPEVEEKPAWQGEFSDELGGAEVLSMDSGTEPTFGGGRFGGLRSRNKKAGIGSNGQNTEKNLTKVETNDHNADFWVQDAEKSPFNPSQIRSAGQPANVSNPTAPLKPQGPQVEKPDDEKEPTPQEVLSAISNMRRVAPPREPTTTLDINALMSLNEGEMSILEQAIDREVSPSDAQLQEELGVGRPRLSQIFNGLLKSGILTVRKQGRSRLFRISAPAKGHLANIGSGGDF